MRNASASSFLVTTAVGALLIAGAAHAQTSDTVPSSPIGAAGQGVQTSADTGSAVPATPEVAGDTIVVTGSRIVRPDLQAVSPVTTISGQAFKTQNAVTVEELLNVNPQFQPAEGAGENNPGLGVATVDLRGLGDQRNLVLVDGKRVPFFDTTGAVDINMISPILIKRVDVLTGGASAVYGSDAISGVVNFVLDDRFTGVKADASYRLTGIGDAATYDAAVIAGIKLGDRGNIVASGNYSRRNGVFYGDRPANAQSLNSSTLTFQGSSNTFPTAFDIPGGGRQQVTQAGGLTRTVQTYNTNATNYASTPLERYGATVLGRYEIAPGLEIYGRGIYQHVRVNTQLAPTATAGFAFDIHPDNPLLNAAERNAFFNVAANPSLVINPDGSSTIGIRRRVIETGGRLEDHLTRTYQGVGGLRGDLSPTLHFDVFGQYAEVKRNEVFKNDLSYNALTDALDAVAGPGGTAVCRSATARAAGCQPFNLFSYTGITPGALSYVQRNATQNSKSTQLVAGGSLSGDIGFLKSPFADQPAAFSVGGEYRRERASTLVDPLFASGDLIYYGQGQSVSGQFNVKEGFGELKIPIVQDRPFFHALDLEGGIRYSDYSTVGSVYSYKAGGDWSPVEGIRFRGVYQRAVRAPNIYELYSPQVSGTTSIATDPCVGTGQGAAIQAICVAQGAPQRLYAAGGTGAAAPILGQINGFFGGNPQLQAEKSDTYTVGVVLAPMRFPAFSLSVDYYNIRINNAVETVQATDVINQCYNIDRNAGSASCAGIKRNPIDGSLSGNITYGVPVVYQNLAVIKTDGIDLSTGYHGGSPDRFNYAISYSGNYILNYKKQTSATSNNYQCAGHFGADCQVQPQPRYKHTANLVLGYGGVSLVTRWRHLGKITEDGDTDILVGKIKAFNYFDETVTVNVMKRLDFRVGVQNLANKKPPIVGDTVGDVYNFGSTYPQVYDVLGRTFFAGVTVTM